MNGWLRVGTSRAYSKNLTGPHPSHQRVRAQSEASIEVVTTEQGLAGLELDWDRLSRGGASPNAFMTFDWFCAWNAAFSAQSPPPRRRLHILVVKSHKQIVAIAPLVMVTSWRLGIRCRALQFCGPMGDYNELIVGEDRWIAPVLEFLTQTSEQWDCIQLHDLRDADDMIAQLSAALSHSPLSYRLNVEADRCPYMPFEGPWAETVQKRSPATRRTFRLKQSRLRRLGAQGLRVRIVENPELDPGLLEKMIAVEAQKHVGGKKASPFIGGHRQVFESLLARLGAKGWLCVAVMELGDRLIAWELVFRCGQKLWGYVSAYDRAYSRLSPGTMLMPNLIDYGYPRGFREYDFLRGNEPYKSWWTSLSRSNYALVIWNHRFKSRLGKWVHLDVAPVVRMPLTIIRGYVGRFVRSARGAAAGRGARSRFGGPGG